MLVTILLLAGIELFYGNIFAYLIYIAFVLRILLRRYFFTERRTAYEKKYQKQRTDKRDVEYSVLRSARPYRENIKAQPYTLLTQIIRMS